MIYKGTIGTGGTITSLPTTYLTGWTYRVVSTGTYAGVVCEVGDLITALIDRNGTGNLNSDWTVAQTNIDGAVIETRKINAGNGLTGGGSLAADRTINVGAGNGINVNADAIAVKPNATGTAGSLGTTTVDANGVGVNLGNSSTTAFRGDQGKTAYDHSQAAHARTDATKTEKSSTNGNVKINDIETEVYRLPDGAAVTASERINWNDSNSKKHVHENKAIIDKITQALIDNWNAAFTHVSDAVKHITSTERNNWNDANVKKHLHSNKDLLDNITQTLVDKWNSALTSLPVHSHTSLNAINITGAIVDVNNYNLSSGSPQIQLYVEKTSGGASNITNIPVTGQPFLLIIESIRWASSTDYISRQVFISATTKKNYERFCTNGTWSTWGRMDYTHPNSGVTAGTYKSVTVNVQGHVTGGTNPTTLAGYGITDAAAKSHTHTKSQITDMPTKLSQFNNDSGYLTSADIDTSQNHVHTNKVVLDKITQIMLDKLAGIEDGANKYVHPSAHPASMITEDTTHRFLTDFCKTITDWNNATTNGYYMASGGTNAPATGWFFGYVIAHNANYVYQEAYQFTASTDAKAIPKYIRCKMNGTWGAWTNVTVSVAVPASAKFTDTDTKNTAGSTNSSSKLFLIGATSQAASPQTYSHDTVYVGSDGCLYSNNTKVSVDGHTHNYAGSSSAGGAANSATKATQDASGNVITTSYASSVSLSNNNLLLKSKSGATLSTIDLSSVGGSEIIASAEPSSQATNGHWLQPY